MAMWYKAGPLSDKINSCCQSNESKFSEIADDVIQKFNDLNIAESDFTEMAVTKLRDLLFC
jgi:hypothetical protein